MAMQSLSQTANAIGLAAASVAPIWTIKVSTVEMNQQWVVAASKNVRNSFIVSRSPAQIKLRERFAAMRALKDGWDGGEAVAPDGQVIAKAAKVLDYALRQLAHVDAPAIVPVADGGLQAEWYSLDYRFEVYFEAAGDMAAWSQDRSTGVETETMVQTL